MATKEEALQYIKSLAAGQIITKDELVTAYNEGSGVKTDQVLTKKLGIAEILYYVGGGIVVLGIAIFIWQNWSSLNVGTRILATLGAGVAAYSVGFLFSRDEKTETIGSAFYLISMLVLPTGFYVFLDSFGIRVDSFGVMSLVSGTLFAIYMLSFIIFRKSIFVLFSILFATWFYYSFVFYLIGDNFDETQYEYLTLAAGLAYIFLGYSFSKNERAPLSGFLYGFGVLGFLGAALALGGWEPRQNAFWELIFPGLVFGVLFISVHIKSRAFLTFGTLFLMGYILKITAEYFTTGLGWPLALVIAGLLLIGVGYMSLYLKKKYITA